jgi:hypothetical protein
MEENLLKRETPKQEAAALRDMAERARADKAREDKFRAEARAELDAEFPVPQSGYTPCACRDCMDTTVSSDVTTPELCSECADAGCDTWSSREGHSAFECQREDAYGE